LLSEVKLSEYEDSKGERTDRNRVLLSRYFMDSYKANYLKNIDVEFYWSLSSPIAKRLYRLVDKKRNGRSLWEAELFSLKDRIPLSDYKYASKIKEKLAPAHTELIEKDFLRRVSYRNSGGNEFVSYEITEGFHVRRVASVLERPRGDEIFCIQRLKAEGMGSNAAEELVAKHGPERCLRYCEAVTFQRNIRNRAGWLRWAIEHAPELDLPAPAAENTSSYNPQATVKTTMGEYAEIEISPSPVVDPRAEEVWDLVLKELFQKIDEPSSRVWFEGVMTTGFEDSTLTLKVSNSFAKEYIEAHYSGLLRSVLQEQVGLGAELSISCEGSDSS
jgi:plasmid replication initiation protein